MFLKGIINDFENNKKICFFSYFPFCNYISEHQKNLTFLGQTVRMKVLCCETFIDFIHLSLRSIF
jgi:hypothetical protein